MREIRRATNVIATQLLFLVELTVMLVNSRAEIARITAEGDIQIFPEAVLALTDLFML